MLKKEKSSLMHKVYVQRRHAPHTMKLEGIFFYMDLQQQFLTDCIARENNINPRH